MASNLQRQARFFTLCALAFVILQFALLLLLMQLGILENFFAHKLRWPQRRASPSISSAVAWEQFIAHTPGQPDTFYGYRLVRSNKFGPIRELPRTRNESCARNSYRLPPAAKVSVIISFHNEPRSMLARTVISLISRTPKDYLQELIVIDDCSDDHHLLYDFENLMSQLYGANRQHLLITWRNTERKGLIRSRNEGARLAKGKYLLFLDSHCEVNEGWLEPLLERFRENEHKAVSPVLDRIDPQTLTYQEGNAQLKGSFDWSLHFHWINRTLAAAEPLARPYISPAFAGGIFMIPRQRFNLLNGFNPHLQIWGGESIEFAIKQWLCGGLIEIVPCSRIGHIFRPKHVFNFPPPADASLFAQDVDSGQATYLRNSKIIAESWLDEYKYLFYVLRPAAKQIPLNISSSLQELEKFKSQLQCQPFEWYLRHIHKELKPAHADFAALGSLRNDGRCLHVEVEAEQHTSKPGKQGKLLLSSCYRNDLSQWYLHRVSGQLRNQAGLCLMVLADPQPVLTLKACKRGLQALQQRWHRQGTNLRHEATHLCLDNPLGNLVDVSLCRAGGHSQSFQFALEMEALT